MKAELSFKIGGYEGNAMQWAQGKLVEFRVTPDLYLKALMPVEGEPPVEGAPIVQIWSMQAAVWGNDAEVYVRPCEIPFLIQALRDAAEFWGILPSSGGKSAAQGALLSSSVPVKTWLSDDLSVVAFPSGFTVGAYAHNLKAQKARMLVLSSIAATDAGLCILPSDILPLIDVLGEAKGILEGDECLHTDA